MMERLLVIRSWLSLIELKGEYISCEHTRLSLTAILGCSSPNNTEKLPGAHPAASSAPASPTAPAESELENPIEEEAISVQLVSAQYMVDDLTQPIVFEVTPK